MDGEWIATEPSVPPGRPSRSEQLGDEVAELRAEVVVLRAAYAGLAARLRKLERWIAGTGRVPGPEIAAPKQVAVAAFEPASVPLDPPRAAITEALPPAAAVAPVEQVRAAPSPTMAFGQTLEADNPGASPAPVSVPAAAAASEEAELPAVELPDLGSVTGYLRQLIGDGVALERVREKFSLGGAELAELDASMFVDDQGRDRVLALSNLRGTIELGGQLLGVSKQAIEEQIDGGIAEPDLVLAMSEIFNNLSGVVNREGNNPQLKAEAVAKISLERVPWLARPSSTLILETPTGGRLWFVAR
jgi:hypothetical protein